MEDGKKVMKVKSEMFDAFERVRPILEEYLDSWVLTGTRAGCKTKVVLADVEKNSVVMKEQLINAQEWKTEPVGDTC
jgi:hypothetical protein